MTEVKTCSGRPAGSLVLSLCLPVGLALCILIGPHFGPKGLQQTGDHQKFTGPAWAANPGQNDLAAPSAEVDPTRIHCAQVEYDALLHYRLGLPASLRAAKTLPERRYVQNRLGEYEDDYRCIYQEVTPKGRRQARLPVPNS